MNKITIAIKGNCPICGFPVMALEVAADGKDILHPYCCRCGDYFITDEAISRLPKNPNQKLAISAFITHNQKIVIKSQDIEKLSRLHQIIPPEKADIMLQIFAEKNPVPGKSIQNLWKRYAKLDNIIRRPDFMDLAQKADPNYLECLNIVAQCQIVDVSELIYLTEKILIKNKAFLEVESTDIWKITPRGWDHIYSLQTANRDSQAAFVAMRFLDKLKDFSDKYIMPAIFNAGYKPIRVDMEQHNDLIDDRIIAGIRGSKFIVADLTENSYGVYFETGFARDLGLPVIYLCNKKYFEEKGVHFDINHYSFLLWKDDKGPEIMEKLQLRIEATIGRGTYSQELEKNTQLPQK